MRRNDRLSGFTLVELLVVISIIAVLMGILLPAVQSTRESGRKATCISNQKNIALACMRFDDASGFLPGWRNRFLRNNGAATFPSWPVMVLPFMERSDIYKSWAANTLSTPPYLSFYVCPTSPPDSFTGPTLAYAGNCGSASNAIAVSGTGRRFDGVMVDTFATGALAFKSTLDMVGEGDGTAMTLLVSEKCISSVVGFVQGRWNVIPASTGSFIFAGTETAVPGFGVNDVATPPLNLKAINPIDFGPPGQASQPSSNHPGGVVAGFCDGHVVFLKDSLNPSVYAQLLSPDHAKSTNRWSAASKNPLSEGEFQ